jgi:protein-tyrosine phosphatase
MIDLHSHILPGVDDGARTLDDSLEIARAAVADGITAIAATPHVRHDYPTSARAMEERVAELGDALAEAEIPLDLRTGGEIDVEWLERLPLQDLRRYGLGGNPGYLLVETPYHGWPSKLVRELLGLVESGIVPVLAHPERNADVQVEPGSLVPLVRNGVLVQVTAASIDGRVGRRAQRTGLDLIEYGLAHLIASDAHHASVRAVGMTEAARRVGNEELATWLTQAVPAAIVDGDPIPDRPAGGPKLPLFRKLRRATAR